MNDALPELKKGDVLVCGDSNETIGTFTVFRVGEGREMDEPVYYLQGMYGVHLKRPYTGEELAKMGCRLKKNAGEEVTRGTGGAP